MNDEPSQHDRRTHGLSHGELKRKTFLSIVWTLVRTAADQVFSLAVFVILARKLGPHEFGVFALATLVAGLGGIVASAGLVQALTRSRTVKPELADTVFWSNLILSAVMAAAGMALAGPTASLLGNADAAEPLRILWIALPLAALGSTHMTLRLREFGHKSVALRSLLAGLVGGGAAVWAAFAGWGVWSLIVQRLVTVAVGVVTAWGSYRWMPAPRISWRELRGVAGFSGDLVLTQVLFFAVVRVQDVIISRLIGSAALGVYRTAWRVTDLISHGVIQPFTTVALQTLSRLQDQPAAFAAAYRRLVTSCALAAFPAIVGFGVLAPQAVPWLFGDHWAQSGRLAQVFAFMAVPFTLNYFASPALAALGRSASVRWLAIVQVTLTVILSLIGARWGLMGVAVAYVVRAYLTLPLQMRFFWLASGIGYKESLGAIRAPFLASTAMAVALLAGGPWLRALLGSGALYLAVMVLIGAAIYVILVGLLSPGAWASIVGEVMSYLKSGRGPKPPPE